MSQPVWTGSVKKIYRDKKTHIEFVLFMSISKKKLREEQKLWLDEIQRRSGDNYTQMTESCNMIAEKSGLKLLGKDTLRHFYYNYQEAEDRTLNDRAVLLLYKAYDIEPTFSAELMYNMDNDSADISTYAKFCKQYITDISVAKGIYRMDIARNAGLHPTIFSKLFGNKLQNGLDEKTLEAIKDRYKVNYSPRFREFLESGKKDIDEIFVVGYVSLKSSDQVLLYPENKRRKVPTQEGLDVSCAKVIELKGPTINPMVKEGMLYYYNESKAGVTDDCLDETCVVEAEDGKIYIKMIEETNKSNVYRLHSLIGGQIEEMKLKRASRIVLARTS